MHDGLRTKLTARERWAYRLALLSMAAFTGLGVYVLYYPSEDLITLFALLMLVTLLIGAISGLLAAGASASAPHSPAPSPSDDVDRREREQS